MFSRLVKSKTFWTALTGIIAAVGAKVTGEIETTAMLQTIGAALLAMFIRDSIAKTGTA